MATRARRRRTRRREEWLPGIATGALVALGAWLVSWWIVPVAALLAGMFWWDRADVARQAMWGAVGGWCLLLVVDSLHLRTWALARALGGVIYLPWGLLIPVTLLFAAALAWSAAVLAQTGTALIAARRAE